MIACEDAASWADALVAIGLAIVTFGFFGFFGFIAWLVLK